MAALLIALLLAQAAQPAPAQPAPADEEKEAPSAVAAMNRARVTFEYGDYPQAAKLLSALVETGRFQSAALRAEAYRLLGLALFYQGRKGEAYSAFLEYLYLEPDAELDPFYVPPAAVAFFEQVKKEAEPKLAPLRAQNRAQQQARQKAAAEEAERLRLAAQEEERQRLIRLRPNVERRVVQHEFWVTMMPFGIGQFQNGDRSLGITLATLESVSAATSAGSALLIEVLRQENGRFSSSNYQIAQRLDVAKWVGAAVFLALWAGGAVHAAIHYQPEEQLPDRLLPPPGVR